LNRRLLALEGVACVRGGRLLFEGLSLALGPGEVAPKSLGQPRDRGFGKPLYRRRVRREGLTRLHR
jgi:hypothetical protein